MNKLDNFAKSHVNKFIYIGTPIIITLFCVLMLLIKTDIVTAGNLSWKDSAVTKANMDLAVSGQETTDDLLNKVITIPVNEDEIEKFIREQIALQDKLIEEYYQAKLLGLSSDKDLEVLKAQIVNIRNNLTLDFERQIDVVFVEYQK